MTPVHFPTEDEIRHAYHLGEEAVVALFREMVLNMPFGRVGLTALSDELQARADAFEAADQEAQAGLTKISDALLASTEQTKIILVPFIQALVFQLQLVERHLRLGPLSEESRIGADHGWITPPDTDRPPHIRHGFGSTCRPKIGSPS